MNGSAESGLPPRQLSDFPKRNDSVLTPYRFLSSMVSHTVLVDARETTGWQVTEDLIDVQYAACYTKGVDTTMRDIHTRSEGSVKWLHYGTTEGAYLNYPGFLWPRSCGGSQCGETYDPRSRPWYAQGATGTKNVVIIIDTSGSMQNVRAAACEARSYTR